MDERDERSIDVSELVTKPPTNGERPLPRRQPKGLLPGTWVGRTLRLEYLDAWGAGATTDATLLELYPFGPVLSIDGAKTALSWDRLVLAELTDD